MRVSEIMTTGVQTVPATMEASRAWALMRRERIRHLIVVEGAEVVGVVSDRDTGGRTAAAIPAQSTVGELMTDVVVTATPDDTVRRIANVMRGRTIGCVPVVSGKRLVGIVTTSDLLGLLGRGIDRPVPRPRRTLSHRAPHRKRNCAYGVW
jgi:acetoin utilization protein AcuB